MFDTIVNFENYWIYTDFIKNKGEMTLDVNQQIKKENWSNHFEAIHCILRDGIDDPSLFKAKINLIIGGHEFGLTIHDYWLNLILWSLIIKSDCEIEPKHIFLKREVTAKDIKKYIDKFFIEVHVEDIDFLTKNNMIADALYHIAKVDEFADLFVNSINLQDDVLMMNAIPEYYDLLHPDMSKVDLQKANDYGMECISKVRDYVLKSKDILGYDHIYTNAFRANESINIRQLKEYAISIGTKPDGNGSVFPHVIANSYINGGVTDLMDYFIESSAGRTAQIISKINVGSSGAMARKIGLNNQGTRLHPDPHFKCSSRNFIRYDIKDAKELSLMIGKYYRFDQVKDFDLGPITEADTHLIGKTIYTRSPITCQSHSEGEGICRYCYGDLYFINKDIDVGKYPSEDITASTTQLQLSAKHVLVTDIPDIELPIKFVENFVRSAETISLIEDRNYNDIYLRFHIDEIFKDNEDDVDDTTNTVLEYNDYVNKFTIIDRKEEYPIEIDKIDKFYLSEPLVRLTNMKRYQTDEGEINIPISILAKEEDQTIFYTPIVNNEFSKTLNRIKDILDKAAVTTSFTKDDLAQEFMRALLNGGMSKHTVHTETILSNQIRSAYNIFDKPNWNNVNEPYVLLPLTKALYENPSITKTLDFQNLASILKNPSSYNKTAPSTIDYFFQEQPQLFMNQPSLTNKDIRNERKLTDALVNEEI